MADASTGTYYSTLDLFPQQTPEHNQVHKFYDNLKEGTLTTTRCPRCGYIAWPPRTVCPACISGELEWIALSRTGTVDVFTVQWAGHPPGLGVPLVLAMVALPDGPTILSRLVETPPDAVYDGCAVELVVLPVDRDRVTYAFRKVP